MGVHSMRQPLCVGACLCVCVCVLFVCVCRVLVKPREGKKKRANVTHDSRLVTHGSTKRAQTRLTSVIGREPVHSRWYERWRRSHPRIHPIWRPSPRKCTVGSVEAILDGQSSMSSKRNNGLMCCPPVLPDASVVGSEQKKLLRWVRRFWLAKERSAFSSTKNTEINPHPASQEE